MHRHARLGPVLIIVLFAVLAGAVTLASPTTAPAGIAAPAVSPVHVTPHPADDEVSPAPATRHLTAPTLVGLLAEFTPASTAGLASGEVPPQHHEPATQQFGPRHGRAPPAITDR